MFIVRSKADAHIRNLMQDLGYDENDEDIEDHCIDYQVRAQHLLINTTKNDLETNLEEAGLAKRDIFIVSRHVVYSLVTDKWDKKPPPMIDEVPLIKSVLMAAHKQCYVAQTPQIPAKAPVAVEVVAEAPKGNLSIEDAL